MYVLALATDYDGTLAHDGIVSDEALAALERLAASGRKLILVTGRELPDLEKVFARIDIFDRVVAENGALLYTPASRTERELAPKPSPELVKRLSVRGVAPISVGRSVIATWEPHEAAALEEIKRLGLELEIIFNKGAVMILPSGVNKASGLAAALEELQLSPHNVVGVGDAENDHAFLRTVGFGVAVSNALPQVKKTADFVTERARGDGVIELAEHLLEEDAGLFATERHRIQVGRQAEGAAVTVSPSGGSILLSGTSGIGKSTLATAMMERFAEQKFQFCVIDPEGDYEELEDVVTVGDGKTAPSTQQILDLLAKPSSNLVINLLGIKIDERPNYFAKLMPDLASLRARTGRPHWLIIDEAHHLLPTARDGASLAVPQALPATILITVHPDLVSPDVLAGVDTVIALGAKADEVITTFCSILEVPPPKGNRPPAHDKVLFWDRTDSAGKACAIEVERPLQARKRHRRKYAEGDLKDHSFYFTGADGKLNLKAQNLMMFVHLAEGIDDDTWEHHRQAGDYSAWFRDKVKDSELAEEAAPIEEDAALDAKASRERIIEAVLKRYTVPAD